MNLNLALAYETTHELRTTLELPTTAVVSPVAAFIMFTQRHASLQIPKIRQNLRSSFSRASCFWTHCKTSQHPSNQLLRKRWPGTRTDGASLFSTSAVQRSQPDDARRQPTKVPMDKGIKKVCFIIVHSYFMFSHSLLFNSISSSLHFLDDASVYFQPPQHAKENFTVPQ